MMILDLIVTNEIPHPPPPPQLVAKQTLQEKEDFDAHMKEMKDKIFVLENKK